MTKGLDKIKFERNLSNDGWLVNFRTSNTLQIHNQNIFDKNIPLSERECHTMHIGIPDTGENGWHGVLDGQTREDAPAAMMVTKLENITCVINSSHYHL